MNEIIFNKTGNFWFDCGIVGFYRFLKNEIKYDSTKIELELLHDKLVLTSDLDKDTLTNELSEIYDKLCKEYYSISTLKQINQRDNYNLLYHMEKKKFEAIPKIKPVGIVGIFCTKATGKNYQIQTKNNIMSYKNVKNEEGLPDIDSIKREIEKYGIKKLEKLWIEKPYAKPKQEIKPLVEKKSDDKCHVCQSENLVVKEINSTSYPFVGSNSGIKSSFSNAKPSMKICWKCSYMAKFVPVVGFFKRNQKANSYFVFFPYSRNLNEINDFLNKIKGFEIPKDPEWISNIDTSFEKLDIKKLYNENEVSFIFLLEIAKQLLQTNKRENGNKSSIVDSFITSSESVNYSVYIINSRKFGSSYRGKNCYEFKDFQYLTQLIIIFESTKMILRFFTSLYDKSALRSKKDPAHFRNNILNYILTKRSIVNRMEAFCYHDFESKKSYDLYNILYFLEKYEQFIGGNDFMTKEEQEIAVNLGTQLGSTLHKADPDKKGNRKGDLFKLRKCRTKIAFLNELNRLQFRYNITLNKDIMKGKLTDDNFNEFKAFTMISAANTFISGDKKDKTKEKENGK